HTPPADHTPPAEAAEDGGGAQRRASSEGGSEATTPRPGASTSSYKHPTLALMAELAARESTTGPLATGPLAAAPARTSAPDAGESQDLAEAEETAASAEAETPA